ncbi:MAG: hypothetical protein IPM60_03850 [Rhodospirillales bacterium]|nr:hypothetical protein [Rhodospirillales bacterium]
MATLYFIAAGVVLYLIADRLLDLIERYRGARFEQRTLVFFAILLVLALVTFPILRRVAGS